MQFKTHYFTEDLARELAREHGGFTQIHDKVFSFGDETAEGPEVYLTNALFVPVNDNDGQPNGFIPMSIPDSQKNRIRDIVLARGGWIMDDGTLQTEPVVIILFEGPDDLIRFARHVRDEFDQETVCVIVNDQVRFV